jgi:hypothetical protein
MEAIRSVTEHKIEFEPGEVIHPEYSPSNDLVALVVNDSGLESLREAVSPPDSGGSSGEEPASERPSEGKKGESGELLDIGAVDLGMVIVEYEVRVPPEMGNS